VTEALPEVELPAAVCAAAERVIKHIEKLAIAAILQWFFIVTSNSFSLFGFSESGGLAKAGTLNIQMRFYQPRATVRTKKSVPGLVTEGVEPCRG
jgi:hypothetical protein